MGGIKQASKFLLPLKTRCPRSLPLLLLAGQSYLMQVHCCMPCIMFFMLDMHQQQQERRSLNTLCLQQAMHKLFNSSLRRTIPAGRHCTSCSRPHWTNSCLQGQWDLALHELFQAYQLAKEEPLVMLCLSVALLQKSMSRKAEDRNKIILQAFAFMQVDSATRMHFKCVALCRMRLQIVVSFCPLAIAAPVEQSDVQRLLLDNPCQEVTAASCVWHLHACLHGPFSGALTSSCL